MISRQPPFRLLQLEFARERERYFFSPVPLGTLPKGDVPPRGTRPTRSSVRGDAKMTTDSRTVGSCDDNPVKMPAF